MSLSFPPMDFSGGGGGDGSAPAGSLDYPSFDPNAVASGPVVQHGSHSWSGFTKGFLRGGLQTVEALPGIAVEAFTHPGRLAHESAASIADTAKKEALLPRAAANLIVGDTKDAAKFYDQYRTWFYDNPFPATLAALGGGKALGGRIGALRELSGPGVVRAATNPEIARAAIFGHDTPISTRTIDVQLGRDVKGVGQQGDVISTRRLGGSHFNANRAYAVDKGLKLLPDRFPLLGQDVRAARATRAGKRIDYLRLLSAPEYVAYRKAHGAMTKDEQTAEGLLMKVPFGKDVDTWKDNLSVVGTPEADLMIKQLNDPKIRERFDNWQNYPRIVKTIEAGHGLEPLRRQVMIDAGALTPEEADAAPWRHTRLLRGAVFATPNWVYKSTRKVDAEIRRLGKEKGKLVPAVKSLLRTDMRDVMKSVRENFNSAVKESGYRGSLLTKDGTDVGKEVDDAFAAKQSIQDEINAAASGHIDTDLLNRLGVPLPEGASVGPMEQAFADASHNALLREHGKDLTSLLDMEKRAKQKRLTTKELDALGLKIPSDLRTATPEELARATQERVTQERMKARLKDRKKYRLTDAEVAKMNARIEELGQTIRDLENPPPIKRSPSTLRRRFDSRYKQAERKLAKRIFKKRQEMADVQAKIGVVHHAPMEQARINVLRILEPRQRAAIRRYERAVAAEYAHGESIKRHLATAEAQAKDEKEIDRIREMRITFIQGQRQRLADLNNSIEDQVALRHDIEASTGKLVGGGTPEELTREAAAKGRPIPYYSPDEMLKQESARGRGAAEGSILPQREKGDIYASRSVLLRTGLLALHPDTLSAAYFRAAKHGLNIAMHDQAMKLATKISKGTALPKGYEYLRRSPGETISQTEKNRGEHLRVMEDEFGREEDISTPDGSDSRVDFTGADGSTYRLIIPKAYANEFRTESTHSATAAGRILKKSMDVWRALILHLRVPWLVNNVVGNTFLFAMRFAGIDGLKSFAEMVASNPATRKYLPGMARLAQSHLSAEQVREIFPEQVRGTHFETQTPEIAPFTPNVIKTPLEQTVAGKRSMAAVAGIPRVLPKLDKAYERQLRKGATNQVLRSSPQVKAIYKEMKRQGSGTFHDAVTKAIADDPHFREYVVQEVNDALGNFLSLSRAERSLLRRTVPFYAWMREITRISGRLAVDHPGRVLLLSQLAAATKDMHPDDIPSYMGGAVLADKAGWLGHLLGGRPGLTTALSLHSMSPYATIADEVQAARALVPGSNNYNVDEFVQNFNPAFSGFYNTVTHGNEQGNLIQRYATELAGSLPQTQLVSPWASKLYPDRTRIDILMKILGNPAVRYDPYVASDQKAAGR